MVTDKLLETIKKNYDKAVSAKAIGSEAEAFAFMDVAQRLLSKHKLEMSEVEWRLEQKKDPIKMHRFEPEGFGIKQLNERVAWTEQLAWVIANENGCNIVIIHGNNSFWIVGSRANRVITEWLIAVMIKHAEKACADKKAEAVAVHPRYADGFDENFFYGFVATVYHRYQELKKAMFHGVDKEKALIRLSNEKALVQQFINNLPGAAPTQSKTVSTYQNTAALNMGAQAAGEVPLQARVVEQKKANVQYLPPGDTNG